MLCAFQKSNRVKILTTLLISFTGGGDTLSRLGYVKSESSMIIEEPEIETEKASEKEDTNSSEGSTGTYSIDSRLLDCMHAK